MYESRLWFFLTIYCAVLRHSIIQASTYCCQSTIDSTSVGINPVLRDCCSVWGQHKSRADVCTEVVWLKDSPSNYCTSFLPTGHKAQHDTFPLSIIVTDSVEASNNFKMSTLIKRHLAVLKSLQSWCASLCEELIQQIYKNCWGT